RRDGGRRLDRSGLRGRVAAVDPVTLELLVVGGVEQRALVARAPADDVVGLAAELAPLLPTGRPRRVGLADLARRLVEEQGLALAVRLDAHVDRRDRGVAEVGRATGLGVARADALEEVRPEGAGVPVVPL